MSFLRSVNENIDEIKHKLVCAELELISARMEADTEIKKYEDTIKRLFQLLKSVCQERDEAKEQLQLLSTKFQPSITPSVTNTSHESQQIEPRKPLVLNKTTPSVKSRSSTKESDMISSKMTFTSLSSDLSLASPERKKSDHEERAEKMKENIGFSRDIMDDSASLVIDSLVLGKQLPEKGRLLRSVTEAGPLLQTLLIAPPPQWKNPPPCSSSSSSGDSAIPTSLSLAFPASNKIIGKKRKLLFG